MKKLIKITIMSFVFEFYVGLCIISEKFHFAREIIIIIAGFGLGSLMADFSIWFDRKFKKFGE